MKITHITLFIILLTAILPAFAQDAKWLRIETEDKDLSVAFPQTNIIDAEKRDFGQRLRVVAFENGVEMEIKFSEESGAKERISRMFDTKAANSNLMKVGDFLVRKSEPEKLDGKNFFTSLAIARKDNFYILSVHANTGDEPEVARFLYSIRLEGKPLFVQNQQSNYQEQNINIEDLQTSADVIEAFERNSGKNKGKVTYELDSKNPDAETDNLKHRAIILDRPFPRFRPQFENGFPIRDTSLEVKLRVQYLADGQVGDIVVLSESDKNFTDSAIDAVRDSVFIPARRGDEFVDSVQKVNFTARTFSSVQTIIRR
jgi:hypothetical protein